MRRHYTINSTICHFHENTHGILHEVDDLLSLINLPASARATLTDKWRGKLLSVSDLEKSINSTSPEQYLAITENLLFAFLSDAQAQHPERTLTDIKALFSKIMQERLDAIVENDSPHQTHSEPGARSAMLKASRATFLTAYYHMNRYEKQRALSPNGANEWHRIKSLLPDKSQVINERHLYALLALIAPIWPENQAYTLTTVAEKIVHVTLHILIEIIKSDSMTKAEKPRFFQEATSQIGQRHEQMKNFDSDQPEP